MATPVRGFNPRLPGGRRLRCTFAVAVPYHRFNPRLPGGRRRRASSASRSNDAFQSTPSGGKATANVADLLASAAFQSTPSGGKATPPLRGLSINATVSIHAFRGEGDTYPPRKPGIVPSFQSTPSGGKATAAFPNTSPRSLFQSTPSGGKATLRVRTATPRVPFQSTPSGGKATTGGARTSGRSRSFNPRLPGGRRHHLFGRCLWVMVSIHAFRGEGDALDLRALSVYSGFNPRLPGGRRHPTGHLQRLRHTFQSTPSGGKATPPPPGT